MGTIIQILGDCMVNCNIGNTLFLTGYAPAPYLGVLHCDLLLGDWDQMLGCSFYLCAALALEPWWSYSTSVWDQAKIHGICSVGARRADVCGADVLL